MTGVVNRFLLSSMDAVASCSRTNLACSGRVGRHVCGCWLCPGIQGAVSCGSSRERKKIVFGGGVADRSATRAQVDVGATIEEIGL